MHNQSARDPGQPHAAQLVQLCQTQSHRLGQGCLNRCCLQAPVRLPMSPHSKNTDKQPSSTIIPSSVACHKTRPLMALSGHASVFALFGGQGINEVYFDELQRLFDTFCPFIEPFLTSTVNQVLQPLVLASQDTSFYKYGLNIISWLTGVTLCPCFPKAEEHAWTICICNTCHLVIPHSI